MLCAAALVSLATTSCADDFYTTSEPTFEVTIDKPIVRVGERAVFNFEGSADIISVYTGEEGCDYEYSSQKRILPSTMYMSFMTTVTGGNPGGNLNPKHFPILYSTDFSGNYTLEDINAATWVEITDMFTLPTDTEQRNIPSGEVCINDLFGDGKKIYLAMHYEVDVYDSALNNGRNQWNIMNFMITGKCDNMVSTLYEQANAGWTFVYEAGYEGCEDCGSSTPNINNSRTLFRSEYKPTVEHKVWCVSGAIELFEDVDFGFDRPVAVKSYADPVRSNYTHIYNEPGEYTATFIGVNASAYGRYEVIREATVQVVYDDGSINQPTPDEWK